MIRLLTIILLSLVLSVPALAQDVGDTCELGDKTKLFISKDGKKYLAKLPKHSAVILKTNNAGRWMVETANGKLGFIKASWLKQICKFTKPTAASASLPQNEPQPETVMGAPDAVETAEAWELALKYDGPSILALSRQGLKTFRDEKGNDNLTSKGGYLVKDFGNKRDLTIIATGSEVSIAMLDAPQVLQGQYQTSSNVSRTNELLLNKA